MHRSEAVLTVLGPYRTPWPSIGDAAADASLELWYVCPGGLELGDHDGRDVPTESVLFVGRVLRP